MATTYIEKGETMNYTAGADITSGQFFLLGVLVVVALKAIANGATGAVAATGVWTAPKTTGEAWTQGCQLYWNDTTKKLTTTSSGNTACGKAWAAAASADATGPAKINV